MAKKPMTAKAYERSAADKAADRKGAKKAGVSLAKYEGAKTDRAADKKAMKALKVKAKR